MKKFLTVMMVLAAAPAAAQTLNPLQQYLYNESGYAPPQLAQPAAPPPVDPYATAYAPAVPQPVVPYTTAYAPPVQPPYYYGTVPQNAAPDGYYEDEGSDVGPSSDKASLRGLLTSSGF